MNNQLLPVTWQKVLKKSIVWIIWLFLLAIFQTTVCARYTVFGAVPNLVLPCVVTIALYDRERTGTIAGIAGGYLIDALGGTRLTFEPLIYMFCGVTVALLTYYFLRREFISWFFSFAVALIIDGGMSVIGLYTCVGTSFITGGMVWQRLLIPQYFASLIVGIPVFLLTRLIWVLLFDNREMES